MSENIPAISIVIPAYNAEQYLGEAVESVLAQSRSDWELVIVDDGSTDGTPALAGQYASRDARISAVHQANAGMAEARNRGFRETNAGSQYVIFLDADDIWEEDILGVLGTALWANPKAVAAHGLPRYTNAQGRVDPSLTDEMLARGRPRIAGRRLVASAADEPTTFAALVVANCITTAGLMLLQRRALENAGPFDSTADVAADWDMWLRLSLSGDIAFVDEPVLRYRQHGGNASRKRHVMDSALHYVRQKLLSSPDLSDEQRRLARLGYQWSQWEASQARWQWARQRIAQRQYFAAAKQIRHGLAARMQFHLLGLGVGAR